MSHTVELELKSPSELLDEIVQLRAALEEIARKQKMDAVAAVSMRAIARAALTNGERT